MEKELATAGHRFIDLAKRVADMKKRGFKLHEIEAIEGEKYGYQTVRLAAKFVHEVKVARFGKCIFAFIVAASLQGCGLFVREADLWGAKFTFPEGLTFRAGANSVDRVDDRQGVSPIKSYNNSDEGKVQKY